MASISFSGVFLAPVDELSDTTYIDSALSVDGNRSQMGEFRRYAGGRVRYITRPGAVDSVSVSCKYVAKSIRDDLEALIGDLVLYRDGRGRKIYGGILSVSATEVAGAAGLVNLAFEVTQVTHSEAV